MSTRITEVDGPGSARTTPRVEGTLRLEEAELLERICRELGQRPGRKSITLDLADLSFLDSDSARVLCRLRAERGVTFEGLRLFVQSAIEMAEPNEKLEGATEFKICGDRK